MRISSLGHILIIGILLMGQQLSKAQRTEDLLKMDLEDIMNVDVTIFSVQGLTQRETPGILTVITEEEIVHSGARDLMDILHQVPGFEFGIDQQSVISIGVRGNWAQEGKVLLMIDGMEMNEILFSCLALGDHYPVEHIQRIEIIRGPGTSFYGNSAELSVINIITKNAVHIQGIESEWVYGRTANAESRRAVTVNFGKKFNNKKIKILSYGSTSLRGDREYTDVYGNQYSMKDYSSIHPLLVNLGMEWGGLKGNFIIDRYAFTQRDAYVGILDIPIDVQFNSIAGQLKYDIPLNPRWILSPGLSYFRQEPWKSVGEDALETEFYYYKTAERIKANLLLKGKVGEIIQTISGIEYDVDQARVSGEKPEYQYFNGERTRVEYKHLSAFAQSFYTKGNTIPSLGLRYDRHNLFGAEFLPWAGITQILGKWSLKCLFGQTFRAPSIENLDINKSIKPEKNTTTEMELGYQVNENWFVMVDYFHTSIKGPILYYLDPRTEVESYVNYKKVGSQGFEVVSKFKWAQGYMNLNYSYYKPVQMIDSYQVEDRPELFLGFPSHKLALNSHFKITPNFSINPSMIFAGSRFGYGTSDPDSNFVLNKYKPKLLANLYFLFSNVLNTKWDLGFGIYNFLNSDYPIIQPYNSGHAPVPNLSREVVMRLKYRWNW